MLLEIVCRVREIDCVIFDDFIAEALPENSIGQELEDDQENDHPEKAEQQLKKNGTRFHFDAEDAWQRRLTPFLRRIGYNMSVFRMLH